MVFACCSYQSQAEDLNALKVKEYRLENGLTVWLNEDHSQPKVFGAVVVKAGAKDCPDTGIAHYFEHMMFKGTDRIGTLDYESEKVLLDSIAMKYDELAMTEDTAARARLQKEINELSIRSSEYVIPNEFNRLINRFGGSGLNAATSYDATIYFNTFSPQYMVQWAEINSERLINPVFRLFQSELETVYEEKNMYGDFIGGQVMDTLMARYFGPHPYAYPIIGSTKNLKNPRLTEMHKFFEDYYVASNMALILSGDFDAQQVMPKRLSPSIYISLTDHINFLLERSTKGELFENPLFNEIKSFYPSEYLVGEKALELIESEAGIELPQDEAASIALHFVIAEYNMGMSDTVNATTMIRECISIVEKELGIKLDELGLHCSRFITHLKFFAQRMFAGELLDNQDQEFLDMIINKYPKEYDISEKISQFVQSKYGYDIPKEEKVYLAVYIKRIQPHIEI